MAMNSKPKNNSIRNSVLLGVTSVFSGAVGGLAYHILSNNKTHAFNEQVISYAEVEKAFGELNGYVNQKYGELQDQVNRGIMRDNSFVDAIEAIRVELHNIRGGLGLERVAVNLPETTPTSTNSAGVALDRKAIQSEFKYAARAALLANGNEVDYDVARNAYELLGDAEASLETGVDTLKRLTSNGVKMNEEAQGALLAGNALHRKEYFAKDTEDSLRKMALADPQGFKQRIMDYRIAEMNWIDGFFTKESVKYGISPTDQNGVIDYLVNGPGRMHIQSGAAKEAERLIEDAKKGSFRFR